MQDVPPDEKGIPWHKWWLWEVQAQAEAYLMELAEREAAEPKAARRRIPEPLLWDEDSAA
jgi:hypothetical protein